MLEFRISPERIQGIVEKKSGGLVTVSKIESEEGLETFGNKIFDYFSSEHFDILPEGCKFLRTFQDGTVIAVIEEKPQIRTVKIELGLEQILEKLKRTGKLEEYGYEKFKPYKTNKFTLAFPYIIHIFAFNIDKFLFSSKIFYRLSPLTSLKDYLLHTNLLNVSFPDAEICLGYESPRSGETSIATGVQSLQDMFWRSTFNIDITSSYSAYSEDKYVSDPLTWQYFSRKDPMFVFKVNWLKSNKNLFGILSTLNELNIQRINRSSNIYYIFSRALYSKKADWKNTNDFTFTSETYYLDKGTVLTRGDEVIINGDKCKLLGLIHNEVDNEVDNDGDDISLFLEKENKDTFIKFLSDDLRRILITQLSEKKPKSVVLKNGDRVHLGDVIVMNDFNHVNRYIKILDIEEKFGEVEVYTSDNSWYLVKNTDFKAINFDTIEINGMRFKEKELYIAIQPSSFYSRSHTFGLIKFEDYDLKGPTGELRLNFLRIIDAKKNLNNLSPTDYEHISFLEKDLSKGKTWVIPFSKVSLYSGLSFQGGELVVGFSDRTSVLYNNIIYYLDGFHFNLTQTVIGELNKIIDYKIKELKFLNSGIELSFKIGDTVIVEDFEQLDNNLKYQTIVDFKIDNQYFYIVTEESGIRTDNKYISFESRYISVDIPLIRHIIPEFNDVEAGTVIRSKVPGIPGFPKKNINEIVGFLTDTKIPLVLCSNLQTIWFDDLKRNFEFNPKLSKHVDLSTPPKNSKWQPGDISYYDNSLCLVVDGKRCMGFYGRLGYYNNQSRKSILNPPRLTGREVSGFSSKVVSPTLFGDYISGIRNNGVTLKVDERRVINV